MVIVYASNEAALMEGLVLAFAAVLYVPKKQLSLIGKLFNHNHTIGPVKQNLST